jgi:predicted nucleic acid-binding protein
MASILDADWIIHALIGEPVAARTLRRILPPQIAVALLTVAGLYDGAYDSANRQARIALFRRFLLPYRFLNPNDEIAVQFAELRAFIRRRGEMIGQFDLIIAATALHYDLTVLTFNIRHIARIPDRRIYRPT